MENVRIFLRQQLDWLTKGLITESNFKYKLADCKKNYPDFDYKTEFALMVEELKELKRKLI